jgi:hypothetical protein
VDGESCRDLGEDCCRSDLFGGVSPSRGSADKQGTKRPSLQTWG